MSTALEVVVVGAGPYGLSIAAHLHARGISSAVFGPAMEVWREHMPKGMLLKSDGFASNLSDPASSFTLKQFCQARGIRYDDTRVPVAIETFVEYAQAFQKQLVPHLDTRRIAGIDRAAEHFVLRLDDGEIVTARRVVLAVGISHFSYLPSTLESLPPDRLWHSSQCNDCTVFQGRRVAVIGGGASAIDIAALMHEAGAEVTVIARADSVRFHTMPGPKPRTIWQRMRNPSSGLGPGWKSRFYTDAAGLFRHFPERDRLRIVRHHLGPAPGWPMRERVQGKIPMLLGRTIATAQVSNGGVRLALQSRAGNSEEHYADHVVSATGYRPDVRRLTFLGQDIQHGLQTVAHAPALTANFESSVPGLYFVGVAAANDFGPMMRFAYGSDYTARRLAKHLQKQVRQDV